MYSVFSPGGLKIRDACIPLFSNNGRLIYPKILDLLDLLQAIEVFIMSEVKARVSLALLQWNRSLD